MDMDHLWRRPSALLAAVAGALALMLLAAPLPVAQSADGEGSGVLEADVAAIHEAFEDGLSCTALTQAYLDRIAAYDDAGPELNSLITVAPNALELARQLDQAYEQEGLTGPLHCIPVVLKDNLDTFDMPTTAGFVGLADSIPPDDATTVAKLRAAGALILAKGNMDEWAHGGAPGGGYSSMGGQTRNPYALDRGPAGSSGGPAAAVAANLAVLAVGTETGGSIRGPAAANGLAAVRPTMGLVSGDGVIPFSLTLDVAGPMARSVRDAALMLDVMAGVDPKDTRTFASLGRTPEVSYTSFLDDDGLQGARIGVLREVFGANPEVDAAIDTAIREMEAQGAVIVDDISIPASFHEGSGALYDEISDLEFKADLAAYLETLGEDQPFQTLADVIAYSERDDVPVYPGVLERLRAAEARGGLDDPAYRRALEVGRPAVQDIVDRMLEEHDLDALVTPTSGCTAEPLPDAEVERICEPAPSASRLAALSGYPAVVVPAGMDSAGLPISVTFLGTGFSEPTLLRLAYGYEQASQLREPPSTTPPLPGEPDL